MGNEIKMKNICFADGSLGNVPILESVLKKSIAQIDTKLLLNYTDSLGMPELRHQIAESYNEKLNENNVMVTSSAQQALNIVFDKLVNSGRKELFLQEPAYFGALRIVKKYSDFNIINFDNFDAIKERLNNSKSGVIYLTSNFHNPTGKSISLENKLELASIAVKNDILIIEDNPYDLIYFDEKPNNIFSLAPKNTIYISSFSKILAPGLRVGYLISDCNTISSLKSGKINYDIFTSTLNQQVCSYALKQNYLDELRDFFRNKRDLTLKILEHEFKGEDGFIWNKPNGGIFIQGKFSSEINCKNIVNVAKEQYSLVLDRDEFNYRDGKSRNTTRINFVSNSDDQLIGGIKNFYKTFRVVKYG